MAEKQTHRRDPFGDSIMALSPEQEEKKPVATAPSNQTESQDGYISGNFSVQSSSAIPQLSTDFAKAYPAMAARGVEGMEYYALVFDKRFPVNMDMVRVLKKLENPNLTRIIESGKIRLAGGEQFCVIAERPKGKSLRDLVRSGVVFSERELRSEIIKPLNEALADIHEHKMNHGMVNPDKVYFDPVSKHTTLTECISSFPGLLQKVAYETIDRAVCVPDAKGHKNPSADYFALGTLAVFLLTREEPLAGVSDEVVIQRRFAEGSAEVICGVHLNNGNIAATVQPLIRGLLSDNNKDRWKEAEVTEWCRKKEKGHVPLSKSHRETATPFIFDGSEYYSRRHLAYAIQKNWAKAKTVIKIADIARWVKLAVKLPASSDLIEGLSEGPYEVILSDEKLARILHLLDPRGPIRLKEYAFNIWGIGSHIAHSYIVGKRDGLQVIGAIFAQGLAEQWINIQDSPDDYSFSNLLWTPFKVAQYIHRAAPGFGMERCLYMLNPNLPCQSPVLSRLYVTNLREMLLALEEISKDKKGKDPLDRHGAAFIGQKIELTDEIRVKSVQRNPALARNPYIIMLALLAVAQSESHIRTLKGLSSWLGDGLSSISDEFHNSRIRRDFKSAVEKISRSGSLNDLFKVISDPSFIRRDQMGFTEARKQYKALSHQLVNLSKQANIERVSYQYGLRISVMFAYFVVVLTLLLVVVRAA